MSRRYSLYSQAKKAREGLWTNLLNSCAETENKMDDKFNKGILFTLLVIIAMTFYVLAYILLRVNAIVYSVPMYIFSVTATMGAIVIWLDEI